MKKVIFTFLIVCCIASCGEDRPTDAAVETGIATEVTDTGATLWGKITEQGTVGVTESGIEFNSQRIPHTTTRDGSFGVQLTDLTQGTQYHYRAYAMQGIGRIIYGEEREFTTLTPTDFWVNFDNITHESADVVFGNTDQLSGWGFYYRAGIEQATTANAKVEANGRQMVTLEDLQPNTRYQILGYATGKNGLAAPDVHRNFTSSLQVFLRLKF